MGFRKSILPTTIMCVILILLAMIDMFRGMGLSSAGAAENQVILQMVRLPRILTALIAGGGLAVAGTQMQSILRNPLADPHIMGISSGASLGAAIAVLAGGGLAISGSIFHGASLAIAAIAL